jgi:hypothetical protein
MLSLPKHGRAAEGRNPLVRSAFFVLTVLILYKKIRGGIYEGAQEKK